MKNNQYETGSNKEEGKNIREFEIPFFNQEGGAWLSPPTERASNLKSLIRFDLNQCRQQVMIQSKASLESSPFEQQQIVNINKALIQLRGITTLPGLIDLLDEIDEDNKLLRMVAADSRPPLSPSEATPLENFSEKLEEIRAVYSKIETSPENPEVFGANINM